MTIYCIKPNLGCPSLVSKSDMIFTAVVATDQVNADMKSVLKGTLFLQPLCDTRRVIQDVATADNYVSL
jgi:hypothetical protein